MPFPRTEFRENRFRYASDYRASQCTVDVLPTQQITVCAKVWTGRALQRVLLCDGRRSWSTISRAYNTTVPLVDGTSIRFVSRERPKLLMGADGRPAYLSVSCYQQPCPVCAAWYVLCSCLVGTTTKNVESKRSLRAECGATEASCRSRRWSNPYPGGPAERVAAAGGWWHVRSGMIERP